MDGEKLVSNFIKAIAENRQKLLHYTAKLIASNIQSQEIRFSTQL